MKKIYLSFLLSGAMVSMASAQTIYSDPLTGTGTSLTGTKPSVDPSGATWIGDTAHSGGDYNVLATSSGASGQGASDSVLLPLTLDGVSTYNFTVTADPVDFSNALELDFATAGQEATTTSGGEYENLDFYGSVVAGVNVLGAFNHDGLYINNVETDSTDGNPYPGIPQTISISIDSATGAVTFSDYGETVGSGTLTSAQIKSIAYVGLGYPQSNPNSVFTDFSVTETTPMAPEPSTWAMLLGGVIGLLGVNSRRGRQSVG